MIFLASTDKLQLVSSAAASLDVTGSYMDLALTAEPPVVQDTAAPFVAAITTATTTDIVSAPAANNLRKLKFLCVRNKHASLSCDVTILIDRSGTDYEQYKCNLAAGEHLFFTEQLGFIEPIASKLNELKRLTADQAFSSAGALAAINNLSWNVEAGKHYRLLAFLLHSSNATTNGARFAVGGVAMTGMDVGTIDTVTASVTGSTHSAGSVQAVDTAITAQTTGATGRVPAIIGGWINPSASGTFVVKAGAEEAAAMTVRAGSWAELREFD